MPAEREMPRYKCHKEVHALKIKHVQYPAAGPILLIPEDDKYEPIEVTDTWMNKHQPEEPGYFVVYKDGYKSWSPTEAFEEGYTRL